MTSTMIPVKIDHADPTDLYEQVAGQIRRAIADGEAKPGERLPPARDLAAVLAVNTNTVLRALRVLRDRRAARVPAAAVGSPSPPAPEQGAVQHRTRELVEFAPHPRLFDRRARRDGPRGRLTAALSRRAPPS